ncbi:MAG: adenylyl-sulfate kinase [Bacteroidetes bacterium]|nr:adenylyl-sulfate kinase [Bacteroidota bacterium]MBK9415391.1 adenylyl-sulfate kinase [Bacteroidota bacterium]MBL0033256.1 adenylyl-sulfate kinase [Bacteroidota bacterium]MBP6426576.1 adenylyl-sulfate kinase [Bacteroidia bacterium]MBP6657789.1 adenylyl-sulfate kinase [Bacteroidia bacterium]
MFNKTNIVKSIVYRCYSSSITICVAFYLTGSFKKALSIGILDSMFKILSYYFFDSVWHKVVGFKAKPAVIWLTGLSGSGKTTIAKNLMEKFKAKGVVPVLLDGDEIRHAIRQTGYDRDSRRKHNLNVGFIASLFEKQGNIVIVALISPYDDVRNEIRNMCAKFIEVYVSTDLQVCIDRDAKGLYKRAIAGELENFTGISDSYFPPSQPEVVVETATMSIKECTVKILDFYRKQK